MKVTINGREITTERIEELEQREDHYFEIIKTAGYIVIGALIIVCLPGFIHADAFLPIGFWPIESFHAN